MCLHTYRYTYCTNCAKHTVKGSKNTPYISRMRPADSEITHVIGINRSWYKCQDRYKCPSRIYVTRFQPFPRYGKWAQGTHVLMGKCMCPTFGLCKTLTSFVSNNIPEFQSDPSSHSRGMKDWVHLLVHKCARAMHPTYDLWDMHRYFVSNNTHQIWSQSARPFLTHSLAIHFNTTRHALRTRSTPPPPK